MKNFLNVLSVNFRTTRRNKARAFFDRLDINNDKKIDLTLLKNLFIPQNFYKCKLGYFTIGQMQADFSEAIEMFLQTENENWVD